MHPALTLAVNDCIVYLPVLHKPTFEVNVQCCAVIPLRV
eukprot:COSAG02_NODE_21837_length_773_cov_1.227003_2_plen_38_part_01